MPQERVLVVWKGNDITVELTADQDITGAEIVFRSTWRNNGVLRKSSVDVSSGLVITDALTGAFSLSLTPSETRLFPSGSSARYEIEMRLGGVEKSLFYGLVKAREWVNDDD